MVITLPFALLLLDYWPLGRVPGVNGQVSQTEPSPSWSRLALEKLPLLALSVGSAIITVQAQQRGGAMRTTDQFSLGVRIDNAIYAYAMYLWKMIWPVRLAPLYPHPGDSLAAWQVLIAAVVLLAIMLLVFRLRARRYLLVGWLWLLGTMVPVIGLVQVGEAAMADRYVYIPSIGIFVMIAFAVADWAKEKELSVWPALPAAAILIALAFSTHRQIGYWQSNEELWSHTLAVTGNNFVAEDNLGGALILEGKEEEAYPHFEAATRINPKDPMSHSNLGTYFQTHNRMREAVTQYEAAVHLTSEPALLAQTYANLGAAYRTLREDQLARKNFDESLRLNPKQFNAWLGLGLLAQGQGKLDEAVSDLSRSVEAHPTAEGYFELGRTLAQAGHIREALDDYQQALRISPDFSEAKQAADALSEQKR
jgi:Tfp pilus assembly protein PilF